MAGLTLTLASLALPGSAAAAGCEVLDDPRERAGCVAREAARDEARAEVDRRVADVDAASAGDPARGRTAAWQQALEEADGVDASALVEPRPLAAVVGLAWFALVVRRRRRARRGTAA